MYDAWYHIGMMRLFEEQMANILEREPTNRVGVELKLCSVYHHQVKAYRELETV